MFKDQKVLVTGGSGMIGRQLVDILIEKGINTKETLVNYLNNNFFMENHGLYSL